MQKITVLLAAAALVLSVAGLSAQATMQDPMGKPQTWRGEIVDTACYKSKGITAGTGEAHIACAKDCAQKGKLLGILTADDGLLKITGSWANNNYAKLVPFIGQMVEIRGVEGPRTNSYDLRQINQVQKITPVKKTS